MSLSTNLEDGGIAYAILEQADLANISIRYGYEDTNRLDGVYFLQSASGPDATVIGLGDLIAEPVLQGQVAGVSIDPETPRPPREPVNDTPLSLTNLTIEDRSSRLLLGIAVDEGTSARFQVTWEGAAQVRVETSPIDPVILQLEDMDSGQVITGQYGPTRIDDARAQITGLEDWISQTWLVLDSGEFKFCLSTPNPSCHSDQRWQNPVLVCKHPLVQGSAELSLDAESDGGALFVSAAVPYLFETSPNESDGHGLTCERGTGGASDETPVPSLRQLEPS